jgi:N utilization substance protein B
MNRADRAEARRRPAAAGVRRRAARLAALQALYQLAMTETTPQSVLAEFLEQRLDEETDDVRLTEADRIWFGNLVRGVAAEGADLDDMLAAVLADDWPVERLEMVLRILLRQGAYELGYLPEVPARVVINEYVGLAHAFFGGKEPGMVNGVLDRLARTLRPEELEDPGAVRSAGSAN